MNIVGGDGRRPDDTPAEACGTALLVQEIVHISEPLIFRSDSRSELLTRKKRTADDAEFADFFLIRDIRVIRGQIFLSS